MTNPNVAWRLYQEILEQNLVRYSAQAATYSAARPAEVDFAQIRLAKEPVVGKFRGLRDWKPIPLGSARINPAFDGFNLPLRQNPLVFKMIVAHSREPGRHVAILDDFRDLRRPFAHVLVGQQIEWSGLARAMAI